MTQTKIEWADHNWNPIVGIDGGWGCNKVSPGCDHCYAEILHQRFGGAGDYEKTEHEFRIKEHILNAPAKRRIPTQYFVCSTMDLFHPKVSQPMQILLLNRILQNQRHRFLLLTKRPVKMKKVLQLYAFIYGKDEFPQNLWAGTSVELPQYKGRIDALRACPARIRFLSLEPLLGDLGKLDLTDIHWVIVGGESGPGARPMKEEWVISIREQCLELNIPFFFKQWGGVHKKKNGRLLEGREWNQMP